MELTLPKRPQGKPMYTVAEVAQLIGVSRQAVYADIRKGRLRAVVRRGCSQGYRVKRDDLERWINDQWEYVPQQRGA